MTSEEELSQERAHVRRLKQELRDARRRIRDLERAINSWSGVLRALARKINIPNEIRLIRKARADRRRVMREVDLIRQAGVFDEAWYLKQNSDVARAGLSPLLHYLRYGWEEGRDPSPEFSTNFYLEAYPDTEGTNPLVHYVTIGRLERRETKIKPPQARDSPKYVREIVSAKFDAAFYRKNNPDVVAAGLDPLLHFLEDGWKQGRDPEAGFSVTHYLKTYRDVASAGVNPYYHYLITGQREGRRPLPPAPAKSA
jgi:hypothetical protein